MEATNFISFRELLKDYIREYYGYIDFYMSNKELDRWLSERPISYTYESLEKTASYLADYLLANGAYAQE